MNKGFRPLVEFSDEEITQVLISYIFNYHFRGFSSKNFFAGNSRGFEVRKRHSDQIHLLKELIGTLFTDCVYKLDGLFDMHT